MNTINSFDVNQKINSLPIALLQDVDKYIDFLNFKEQQTIKISQENKKILDERLNDYLQNPNDVQDFDKMLDELEVSLINKGKKDIEDGRLIPHKEAKERIKNYIKSKSLLKNKI